MSKRAFLFLTMQVCFVLAGFGLYFSLKALKQSLQKEDAVVAAQEQGIDCDFDQWVGQAANESLIKETGRPYRVLPPGSMFTEDYVPARLNIHTDENGIVTDIDCG